MTDNLINTFCNVLHNVGGEMLNNNKVETLAGILAEVKRKPDASDVRDNLITDYCQECPDHDNDDYDCGDHECFIWEIFGILTEAEK